MAPPTAPGLPGEVVKDSLAGSLVRAGMADPDTGVVGDVPVFICRAEFVRALEAALCASDAICYEAVLTPPYPRRGRTRWDSSGFLVRRERRAIGRRGLQGS